MRKLEIGSGNRPLPGYEHLDIDPSCPELDYVSSMDVIPVPDNTFDEIVSIHSIEHIGWRKGRSTLAEWHRVLVPGGKLHVATPNLHFICKAYIANDNVWVEDFQKMHREEQDNLLVKDFHCHSMWTNFKLFSSGAGGDEHMACYDKFLLTHLLEEVGFARIKVLCDTDSLIIEAWK